MIKRKISDKFYGGGIEINPTAKKNIADLDHDTIVNLFETNGFILFRNFNLNKNELVKITDLYTLNYANDALRRKSRLGLKEVHNVDYGNDEMALHSEASFSPNWPEIIWFYCNEIADNAKGTTTFCDGLQLWDNLSFKVKNFFLQNPIKYNLKIPITTKKIGNKKKKLVLNLSRCW